MKKIIILSSVLIVLMTAISSINLTVKGTRDMDISFSNIEALASESETSEIRCYVNLIVLAGAKTVECYDCINVNDYYGQGVYHQCKQK